MKHTFEPQFGTKLLFSIISLLWIGGAIIFTILFFQISEIWLKVIIFFLLLSALFLAVITFLYPIKARLTIQDSGIYYQHPLFTIMCCWNDIINIELSYDSLKIIYNKDLLKGKNFLIKNSLSSNIPVEIFVKSYRKRIDWENDFILSTLKEKIPIQQSEIDKYFK